MKIKFFFIIFVIIIMSNNLLFSQIITKNSLHMNVGTIMHQLTNYNQVKIDLSSSNWNFTNYLDGEIDTVEFIYNQDLKNLFPDANLFAYSTGYDEENENDVTYYSAISLTDSDFKIYGTILFYGENFSDSLLTQYSNPKTIYKFPLSNGTKFNDDYALEQHTTIEYSGYTMSMDSYITGIATAEVIKTGKISTSIAKNEDCILLRTIDIEKDSSVTTINGNEQSYVEVDTTTNFEWISPTKGLLASCSVPGYIKSESTINTETFTLILYNSSLTDIKEQNSINNKITISPNFPNPFNNSTKFSINLPINQDITIDIFNINGQKIYNIYKGFLNPGQHNFIWNGKNNNGTKVSSGTYFLNIKTNNQVISKKILLIR